MSDFRILELKEEMIKSKMKIIIEKSNIKSIRQLLKKMKGGKQK